MPGGSEGPSRLELIAYRRRTRTPVEIVPAPRWRQWMNDTSGRFANRCLPLLVANEAGWALLNPVGFTATWNGDDHTRGVSIEFDSVVGRRPPVTSNFGYGIITWGVPTLFRTPSGFNLLARGPVNAPKDGVSPLEGLVETDWAASTFTMNWKITRLDHPVRFEQGEPFCVVVPQRRGELESFHPVLRDLEDEPQLAADNKAWRERRDSMQTRTFIAEHVGPEAEGWGEWEGSYFRGLQENGSRFAEHQTKLRLRPFADERSQPSGPVREDQESTPHEHDVDGERSPVLDVTYRVPEHVDFRAFPSETVVLDLARATRFELNPIAGRMLGLLASARTARQAAHVVAREHGQAVEDVQRDVLALCEQLTELGVLVAAPETDRPG